MTNKLLLSLLVVIVGGCFSKCSNNVGGGKTENHIYHTLTCGYANGWDLEVNLNGVPIHDSEKTSSSAGIDYFVVNGLNTLTVTATQLDDKEKIWGSLVITLWRGDDKNAYKDKLVDVNVAYQNNGYRFAQSYNFNAAMPLTWTWQTASVVGKLSDSDRKEVLTEVGRFYDAIKSKDVERCLRLTEAFVEDMAKYEHKNKEDYAAALRSSFEKIFSDPDFNPELTKEDEILIEVGEKVVLVSGTRDERNEKKPLIYLVPPHGEVNEKSFWSQRVVFKKLVLAKVAGRWRIVVIN